jgi:hypothetical protein
LADLPSGKPGGGFSLCPMNPTDRPIAGAAALLDGKTLTVFLGVDRDGVWLATNPEAPVGHAFPVHPRRVVISAEVLFGEWHPDIAN